LFWHRHRSDNSHFPETRLFRGFLFATFEQGYGAVQEMFQRRQDPALLDFGDDAEKHGDAVLYLVFEGNRELAAAEEKQAVALCRSHGGKELPSRDAEQFWRDRHEIARRFARNRRQRRERGRDGIYRDWIHVALPSSRVPAFAARRLLNATRAATKAVMGAAGTFSMRLTEDGSVANTAGVGKAIEELLRWCNKWRFHGYTHGVGVKLARFAQAWVRFTRCAGSSSLRPNIFSIGKWALAYGPM
jgi:uncharacterized protein YifE (UPF0438 family)